MARRRRSTRSQRKRRMSMQLDEIDIEICAYVDFKLSANPLDREKTVKEGILKPVPGHLEREFKKTFSSKEVERRVDNVKTKLSDKFYDFLRQGTVVLFGLSEGDRRRIDERSESLRLKGYSHELATGQRLTRCKARNQSSEVFDIVVTVPPARVKHQKRRLRRKEILRTTIQGSNIVGSVGQDSPRHETSISLASIRLNAELDSLHTPISLNQAHTGEDISPDLFAQQSDAKLDLTQPRPLLNPASGALPAYGIATSLQSSPNVMWSASSYLEMLIEDKAHLSSRTQLQALALLIQTEHSYLRSHISRLERKLEQKIEQNESLKDERQTLLNTASLGSADEQARQIADLRNTCRRVEAELRREKEHYPFFKLQKLDQDFENSNVIGKLAGEFKQQALHLLCECNSTLGPQHLSILDRDVSRPLIQKIFGKPPATTELLRLQTWANSDLGLSMFVRALFSAVSCLYIFDASFELLLEGWNTILENYRSLITKRHGQETTRSIDFIAHKMWIESELFETGVIQPKSKQLAEQFYDLVKPIFAEEGPENQDRKPGKSDSLLNDMSPLQEAFESALRLKAKALLSPRVYEAKMFAPGCSYNKEWMSFECSRAVTQHPSKLRNPVVHLCLHPAIFSSEVDKEMFDYCGFTTRASKQHQQQQGRRRLVSKARVVLKEGDCKDQILDSEDEMS